ncbi:hypothetical protein Tco_0428901 [Tanacetum coccineum]
MGWIWIGGGEIVFHDKPLDGDSGFHANSLADGGYPVFLITAKLRKVQGSTFDCVKRKIVVIFRATDDSDSNVFEKYSRLCARNVEPRLSGSSAHVNSAESMGSKGEQSTALATATDSTLQIWCALIVAEASLKSVNFLNGGVVDKQVGKYNGGMKNTSE